MPQNLDADRSEANSDGNASLPVIFIGAES